VRTLRLEKSKTELLLLWVSLPHTPPELLDEVKPDLLWYDVTEDFSAMPGLSEAMRRCLQEQDLFWTKAAHIVSAVSMAMRSQKAPIAHRTIDLSNAVDIDIFHLTRTNPLPLELQSFPRPRIIFIGGDPSSQDWDLVRHLANHKPTWSFVFLGNLKDHPNLDEYKSLHFLGTKPYERLPAYLEHSDACMQIYLPGRFNDSRNSQKLLVYLASGKPIVSTRSGDAERYENIVPIADGPEQFLELLEREMATDSPQKQAARRELAAKHSWDARAAEIISVLKGLS